MRIQDRIQIYKELYFYEHERNNKLNTSLQVLIALSFGVAAIFTFYFRIFPVNTFIDIFKNVGIFLYVAFLLASVVFMLFAVCYMYRACWNYAYGYISTPAEIENYFNELDKHYTEKSKYSDVNKRDKTFHDFLTHQLCEYTGINIKNNRRKAMYIHKAKTALVIVYVNLMASILIYMSYIMELT